MKTDSAGEPLDRLLVVAPPEAVVAALLELLVARLGLHRRGLTDGSLLFVVESLFRMRPSYWGIRRKYRNPGAVSVL